MTAALVVALVVGVAAGVTGSAAWRVWSAVRRRPAPPCQCADCELAAAARATRLRSWARAERMMAEQDARDAAGWNRW